MKWKQKESKNPDKRYPEVPVQYIFGYGVKPERVIFTWLITVFILALLYLVGDGIEAGYPPLESIYFSILTTSPWSYILFNMFTPASPWNCLYFSVVTAATPGYGNYYPKPAIWGLPIFQIFAIFEAIFGTFMWAAFIATFARKYMRS